MAHLVPIEPRLPLAQPLTHEVELLGVEPPVLAGHLDRVGLVGPEEAETEILEEEAGPRGHAIDVAVLLELAVGQAGGPIAVGILGSPRRPDSTSPSRFHPKS